MKELSKSLPQNRKSKDKATAIHTNMQQNLVNKINFRHLDYILIALILFLCGFGLCMIYSASFFNAMHQYGNPYFYVEKQLIVVILCIAVMLFFAFWNYNRLEKYWILGIVVSVILLCMVFIPGIGVENYGARRWIRLIFFTIQPSEIAKFAFVLFLSVYLTRNRKKIKNFLYLLPIIAVGGLMCILIILEPNMSITICVAAIMVLMLYVGGAEIKHLLLVSLPLLLAVPVLILMEPYRLKRLFAFLDPWSSPLAEGYQLIQSFYSLGSGGFWGTGYLNSRQKYAFLPFSESDFIFSIIAEEFGFIGAAFVILVYMIIVFRCFRIAMRASNTFGKYLVAGIAGILAIQVVMNLAVITGSIPPTGLPLPFISCGGTSVIMFMAGMGVCLNVDRENRTINMEN